MSSQGDSPEVEVLDADAELRAITARGLTDDALGKLLGLPPAELRTRLRGDRTDTRAVKMARANVRRAVVARLYLSKRRRFEIAEILGVDRSIISRDITAIEKEWKKERVSSVVEFIRVELRELEDMERSAAERFWAAKEEIDRIRWFRVRLELKEKRWRLLGLTAGVELEVLIREELRAEVDEGGDVANLDEVEGAATLVGLYRSTTGATG